jgi:selenocysteine-specific elongation factor
VIIGTAGHIDHGKSSLVRALTGTDPDRLKEEKLRGITIDLGYAYWPRPDGDIVGFVDVPGHEALIHNMLAGATGIDFVLMVVAADDGVMPQTREHLAILDLLGLTRGIVALTKADLAGEERRGEVTADIRSLLAGTGLAGVDIIPVSVQTGEGLPQLIAALDEARATQTKRGSQNRFRLDIDRCFTLPGAGTVVTGTVVSGTVRIGDRLLISPSGLEARVRSIHAQNRESGEGRAGERCALAIAGPDISKSAVTRGQSLVDPALHAPASRIDVTVQLLATERKALGQWQPLRFHHGSFETGAHVVTLGDHPLGPGQSGFAQLVLDAPILVMAGDRFILRDWPASRTLGGGIIHDLRAPERRRKTPQRIAELEALATGDTAAALSGFLGCERGWIELQAFFRDRGTSENAAHEIVASLGIIKLGGACMLPRRWLDYRQRLLAQLDEFHLSNPDVAGLGSERLRLGLAPRLPAPIFAAVLEKLAAGSEVALDRAWVRRPSHAVKLSAEEERIWASIGPSLNGHGRYCPPRVRDIAHATGIAETSVRRLFKLAARRGDVDEIAHDHFFLSAAVGDLAAIARELAGATEPGKFNVIAFRDRIGGGRKVAIQILEYFDRQGFTMRRGDWRRINPHKTNLL